MERMNECGWICINRSKEGMDATTNEGASSTNVQSVVRTRSEALEGAGAPAIYWRWPTRRWYAVVLGAAWNYGAKLSKGEKRPGGTLACRGKNLTRSLRRIAAAEAWDKQSLETSGDGEGRGGEMILVCEESFGIEDVKCDIEGLDVSFICAFYTLHFVQLGRTEVVLNPFLTVAGMNQNSGLIVPLPPSARTWQHFACWFGRARHKCVSVCWSAHMSFFSGDSIRN